MQPLDLPRNFRPQLTVSDKHQNSLRVHPVNRREGFQQKRVVLLLGEAPDVPDDKRVLRDMKGLADARSGCGVIAVHSRIERVVKDSDLTALIRPTAKGIDGRQIGRRDANVYVSGIEQPPDSVRKERLEPAVASGVGRTGDADRSASLFRKLQIHQPRAGGSDAQYVVVPVLADDVCQLPPEAGEIAGFARDAIDSAAHGGNFLVIKAFFRSVDAKIHLEFSSVQFSVQLHQKGFRAARVHGRYDAKQTFHGHYTFK